MPDPNAHADRLKSIGQPETLPTYWWLNPWRAAIQQAKASDIYRAWWLSTDKQLCKTAVDLAGAKLKADATDRNIVDTANEAGFQASKAGYVINGQPHSPFPLKWLGEAVAYWKGEAYAARRERDQLRNEMGEVKRDLDVAQTRLTQAHEILDAVNAEARKVLGDDRLSMAGTKTRVEAVVEELADVKRQLADALADKAEADKHHAEEHAANVRLADEIIQLKDEIFWLKHPVKTKTYVKERPAKRKPKAKKKGGRK